MNKLPQRIKEHLAERAPEWVGSIVLILWGLIVATQHSISTSIFSGLINVLPQHAWGVIGLSIGIIRAIFLAINGAWRKSGHLRALGAILSVTLWVVVLNSYFMSPYIPPGAATIFGYIVLDFFAIWIASADAKKADLEYDSIKVPAAKINL